MDVPVVLHEELARIKSWAGWWV